MNEITVHGKTYKLPKKPVWRSGPPPEIGWWPASIFWQHPDIEGLRFFNGDMWSIVCSPDEGASEAGTKAELAPAVWRVSEVRWTDQWWK